MKKELLFSYGTLQTSAVQIETFGRKLVGYEDQLLDYKLAMLEIQDKSVVELSGETHHPIAIAHQGETVPGKVFEITPEELVQSDKYEVSDYQRVLGKTVSGVSAWVYVKVIKGNQRGQQSTIKGTVKGVSNQRGQYHLILPRCLNFSDFLSPPLGFGLILRLSCASI